ncbi:MAG: DUF1549 and DUF1553 domain-containing protein [Pirellulaceae bacterium]
MDLKRVTQTLIVVFFLQIFFVVAKAEEAAITDADRDHWAFTPLQRPSVPSVVDVEWPQNAIDGFILSALESKGRKAAAAADRSTLLRRVKFDLLGLPPTPSETMEFQRDTRADAYLRLVDRLLDSPAYGERWAQHWLDLARFAETDGFEHDKVRKDAWQYRQWVIDALNSDMPYDRFVTLQLAGDLQDPASACATMFCLAGPDMPDLNEQDLRRHDKLNEITSTVGSVLLGLQMQCAQCHDHKYDAISQLDFYRLRGVFEDAVPAMKRDQPVLTLAQQSQPLTPRLYFRGELEAPGPVVQPRPPRIASLMECSDFDGGNPRQAFAEWLFDNKNPLAARVMANRVWQQHFGQSLCENPSDFGVIAGGPSHPDLLDWLACELRAGGWSLKHLHRTILLSATYQQASSLNERDSSDEEEYACFPRKRLEGEVIRDALLAVSGQLDYCYGGPSVMPPLPQELTSTLLKGQWQASPSEADHYRRSIYVFARRNLRYPIFDVFDRPDAGASCACREQSTTAIQSLQLLNSELAFVAAQRLRDRLLSEHAADLMQTNAIMNSLFMTTLSRSPTDRERTEFSRLFESQTQSLHDQLLVACLAVLNSSEFIYVD